MRRGVELLREQNVLIFDGVIKIALAEAEARAGDLDRALTILDEALATAERTGYRAFEAELHRVRGEIACSSATPPIPRPRKPPSVALSPSRGQQATRSFELRASLALAKLYHSTGRPAEAHAVLAPALEGFSPAPEMPEIAEAQALLAALEQTEEVKADAAKRQRLTHLQVAYGNALIAARGHGARETIEAFARARKSASGDEGAPERLAADYGLWVGSYVRGDLPSMRTHAAAFLAGVAARPNSPEAGVAHRVLGTTHCFAGEYAEAREHLERALILFQPGRDDDLAFRFGQDAGVAAMCYLAIASWPLGNVRRAVSLVDGAHERLASVAHIGTHPYAKYHAAMFELMRGDRARAAENGSKAASLGREHDLPLWRTYGAFLEGLATAERGALGEGLSEMRRVAESLRQQDLLNFDGLLKIALAEAEAQAGDPDRAIAILDEALATADRLGYRAFEAELHRARGEILLKRDPADPAPAEQAFLTAIAVAEQQGARSFELRAALSLAKLYQSTARPADAHAVLGPALEGFSPTPEMPEIAEAQALLAALAGTDEVKAHEAQRQQRLHLQTAYGQAVMYSKGFAAEETKAAFARAAELAAKTDDFSQRFAAAHGQWTVALVRGELRSAREMASAFLQAAENQGRLVEAGVARRGLALICYNAGDFAQARAHCEQALAACDPERDREARERFSEDTGCLTMSILAVTSWQLGEVERARELIEMANQRAAELGHAPSMAHPLQWKFHLELLRGDAAAALAAAEALATLGRDHGMAYWLADAEMFAVWARCRLHDPAAGAVEQGARSRRWFSKALLAELELQTHGVDSALARIDEALVLARQVEGRSNLPFAHLLRGQILLKRDPANRVPAEEAFQTALAVAKEQGARSWGLRAALALAKLYRSSARPVDAHAVLAPALKDWPRSSLLPFGRRAGDEGLSPSDEAVVALTPDPSPERERGTAAAEMPEIAEAEALLAALAESEAVKTAASQGGVAKSS